MADVPEHAPVPAPDVVEEENAEAKELEAEREKHRRRAEKFGVDYVDPSQRRDMRHASRKERFQRAGFATGVDLFAEEEVAKRAQRASRFGTQDQGIQWQAPAMDEDEEKRVARAKRFGTDYKPADAPLMDVDVLESRREPSLTAALRREGIYVYGVDLMSTADILRLFTDYGPMYVEWINDSSCVVTFADGGTAKRALAGQGVALAPEPGSELQGLDAADPENMEYMWHRTRDPVPAAGDNALLMRTASIEDVKPEGRVQSRRLWQHKPGDKRKRARGEADGAARGRGGGDEEMAAEGAARGRKHAGRRRGRGGGPSGAIFAKALQETLGIGDADAGAYGAEDAQHAPSRDALSYADL